MRFPTQSLRSIPLICLILALSLPLSAQLSAQAQSDSDSGNSSSSFNITDPAQASDPIAKLELRIFDHTYKADSQEARIKRLENFVFGAAQTGDTQSRLDKLQKSVTAATPSTPSTAGAGADANTAQKPAEAAKPSFDEADYPRVDQLERQILGQQYSHELLAGRLSRLETKAFGRPSSSTDPADRVDALDAYVARHDIYGGQGGNFGQTAQTMQTGQTTPYSSTPAYGQSTPYTSYQSGYQSGSQSGSQSGYPATSQSGYQGTPASQYGQANTSAYPPNPYANPYAGTGSYGGATATAAATAPYSPYDQANMQPGASNPYLQANVTSTNDRLSSMEKTEFGRDYPNKSLKERVQRLEKKVDPNKKGHEGQSLPARVDQLWAVVSVSNSIGNAPIASSASQQQPNYGNVSNNSNKSHHSLLHSVGKVLGAAAVTAGSAGMMMGGMGMGGMGYGMSRYGMGSYGGYGNYGGYSNYGGLGNYGYGGYGTGYGGYSNYGLGHF